MKTYYKCDPITGCGSYYENVKGDIACPECGVPQAFSSQINGDWRDYIYDLESYPTYFSAAFLHTITKQEMYFEISSRRNDDEQFIEFLQTLIRTNSRGVGFNNLFYDYPMLHFIIENQFNLTPAKINQHNNFIIGMTKDERFNNTIWENEHYFEQIDLYKIHHFDNVSKSTSLKDIEFNLQMESICDLPYKPGSFLTPEQMEKMKPYNKHDVNATYLFYQKSLPMISFREELTEKYQKRFINFSDAKIGSEIFIMELEKASPNCCYEKIDGKRHTRQTKREFIDLSEVIFDYVHLERLEFLTVKNRIASKTIRETKGAFSEEFNIDGCRYTLGTGGLHASIEPCIIESNDEFIIRDVDVGGYYPSLAEANNYAPEHLPTETFIDTVKFIKSQRKKYAKGTPENRAYKLANNGLYGNSNNIYSPFYDPKYTMTTTINGQLLLLMLVEQLLKVPQLKMIQCNTDGVTFRCLRTDIPHVENVCKWWENLTRLTLEHENYKRMFIRDVNNYIGEFEDGKLKSKGAYLFDYEKSDEWHKNFSARVVQKAAEAYLVRGESVKEFIYNHNDIHDFMIKAKVKRTDQAYIEYNYGVEPLTFPQQRVTRYYVAKNGGRLYKVSVPRSPFQVGWYKKKQGVTDDEYFKISEQLEAASDNRFGYTWDERIHTKNQSRYDNPITDLCSGWLVAECNNISTFDKNNLNYDYYIEEAKKLIKPLMS